MALNLKTETVFADDPAAAQAPLPPEQIAPHFPQLEILECLGRGGMGVVYKARQKALNRLVALKLLAPERVGDAEFAERFAREARALAALSHPNIVTVHDFGQSGGFYYLLMEFVDGVNLRQLLRARKFTPEEAVAIVPSLCDALQFAHDHGIVHRDIKPENILLDKNGWVKVADFGIAKMLGADNGGASTDEVVVAAAATQSAVGTPGYSAPEQKTDPQRVDSRADIYSLGVVFYEMLTGELPGKPLQPPSKKVQIDVRLDEVVLRAMEQKPEMRYQQARLLKTQVETIAATPASAQGNDRRTRKSGIVRVTELFFDITFTSPAAIMMLNLSALGFLGSLGSLGFLGFGWHWCFGLFGLFGLFGFIAFAFIAERIHTTVIVGQRGGRVIIQWPVVFLAFLISLVAGESVTVIGSLAIIQRIALLPILLVVVCVTASTIAIVVKRIATPLEKLKPLDALPKGRGSSPPTSPANTSSTHALRLPWWTRCWVLLAIAVVFALILARVMAVYWRPSAPAPAPAQHLVPEGVVESARQQLAIVKAQARAGTATGLEEIQAQQYLHWAEAMYAGKVVEAAKAKRDGAKKRLDLVMIEYQAGIVAFDAVASLQRELAEAEAAVSAAAHQSATPAAGTAMAESNNDGTAIRQEVMAWVEKFFAENYHDITRRDTVDWGEVKSNTNGNLSIRYKYRATILGRDIITNNEVFTFDSQGKFISVKRLYATPKERMMALVEKFFANNFRDITSRQTLGWGDVRTTPDGNTSIRYEYRARIWDRQTATNNQVFTFDAEDTSVKDVR